ncbi:MAG TPA: LAGLIDADG family homing endonuclease [Candidatus Paceibacterota bacterium]
MRKDGFTLTEITNKTGLSKTTIFHHIKSISKSGVLKKKLRIISRMAQKQVAESRRGKSVKNYKFRKPKKWSQDFINLTSHFLFDGAVTRSSCLYYNRNKILVDNMIIQIKNILDVDDYKMYQDRNDVIRLAYHNVELVVFIKDKTIELLNYILSAPKVEKIAFLQSFFDDEGSVDFRKAVRRVRGYQHNDKILFLIQKLLKDFQIASKVDTRFHEIIIGRRENISKFARKINFSKGVKINGKRSNSVWKKSLEKKTILAKLLSSYAQPIKP